MRSIKKKIDFLEPNNMLEKSNEDLLQQCHLLFQKYREIFTNGLVNQFAMFLELVKADLKKDMKMRELFEIVINKYSYMEVDFPEVYVLFLLFFTLPVTVAQLERSFSKLKMLKNCIRSTMNEQRLRDLSILNIEYNIAAKLDLRNLIDNFANAKVRKRPF